MKAAVRRPTHGGAGRVAAAWMVITTTVNAQGGAAPCAYAVFACDEVQAADRVRASLGGKFQLDAVTFAARISHETVRALALEPG